MLATGPSQTRPRGNGNIGASNGSSCSSRSSSRTGSSGNGSRKSHALRGPLNIPENPPRLPRRPPRKGNKRETLQDIARRVPVEIIRPYFNYPLRAAADALCISVTTLKRLCRRHGVKRWPHRQLSGLNRAVSHLEAKQGVSGDPVIADQLRQLYSRRDVVIDLAFMSDEDAPEGNDSASRLASNNKLQSDREDSLSMPATPAQSPGNIDRTTTTTTTTTSQDSMAPWWQRPPGLSPWQGVGNISNSGGGGGAFVMSDGSIAMDVPNAGGGVVGDLDGLSRLGGGGNRGAAGGGEENFRASSVLVRLPGMSPPLSAPSSATTAMSHNRGGHSPTSLKLTPRGGVFAGIPSPQAQVRGAGVGMTAADAAEVAALAVAEASGAGRGVQRRNLSPSMVGRSGKAGVGATPSHAAGRVGKHPSAHFVPCPPNYSTDYCGDEQQHITEFAVLNDILFGPEGGEDPTLLYARAAAAAAAGGIGVGGGLGGGVIGDGGGGGHGIVKERPKAVTLAALESSALRGAAMQQRFSEVDGGGGRLNENGRLPSIAGLVAAGAILGGSEWSCRPPGSYSFMGAQVKYE